MKIATWLFALLVFLTNARADEYFPPSGSGSGTTYTAGSGLTLGTGCPSGTPTTFCLQDGTTLTYSAGALATTSLALGGATLGANKLAVTGTTLLSGKTYFGTNTNQAIDVPGVSQIGLYFGGATSPYTTFSNGDTTMRFDAGIRWTNSTAANGTVDTTLLRAAAGQLVSNGTIGTACYAIGSLPASTAGQLACVNNQLTACPATGTSFTSGGSVTCPAFNNGAGWVGG